MPPPLIYMMVVPKMQLNDLMDYLKSLGGPEQENTNSEAQQKASF